MLTNSELIWLLDEVAKGSKTAFERLYAATSAKLFGVVLRIVQRPALAEQVLQRAYVKIWNGADQFNSVLVPPLAWMVSIARAGAIDAVRKQPVPVMEDGSAPAEGGSEAPDSTARPDMTDDLKRLLECIGKLEPERQRLVLLAYYNGWSREQLAEKFGTPRDTVRIWLRGSLLDLRTCLGLA